MSSYFAYFRGMPHLFEEVLSYLEVPDRMRLAVALEDVRELIQDNGLYPSLRYEVRLLRRGCFDRRGYWIPHSRCFGSLTVVDSTEKFSAMLHLLRQEITDDGWLDQSLQVCFVVAKNRDEACNVGVYLSANLINNFVAHGPLSPKNTFRIRKMSGLFAIVIYRFEGRFRLSSKVRVVALHPPGSTEVFRQLLRIGAVSNDCIAAGDSYDQVVRAAKVVKYLAYKEDTKDRGEMQRTVVPAGWLQLLYSKYFATFITSENRTKP